MSLLVAASLAFVAARRAADGTSLALARGGNGGGAPSRALAAAWAAVVAALLRPLRALADALVFAKVRAALGVRKAVVCGGGALPRHVDDFFEAVGVTVLNGYGLTETSPVLACRR